MGMSERRQTDSVYNHITNACFNLSMHARMVDEATREAIIDTVDQLTRLLDIPDGEPWTLTVHDPGTSSPSLFKPDDGVHLSPPACNATLFTRLADCRRLPRSIRH